MNWKRGLTRLWILASVLWMVGAGALLIDLSSTYERKPLPPPLLTPILFFQWSVGLCMCGTFQRGKRLS